MWIDVNDRLPEIKLDPNASYENRIANVICAFAHGEVRQMRYTFNAYALTERGRQPRWEEINLKLAHSQPTHWTPLPPHPSKSEA